MSETFEINERNQVVPYTAGRKCTDTRAWRDATELELQQQEQISQLERELAAARAQIEANHKATLAIEHSTEGNDSMTAENTDTPQKADCPSAPCSPSGYDAGLLNDFGGGDIGWWQDYLRAEIGRANDYWRQIHDQQDALMVRLYNQGYHAGHEDTVEACFVPIHHTDMDSYHADAVCEILQENDQADPLHGRGKTQPEKQDAES